MSTELIQLVNSQKDNFVKVCSDDSIEFDREASFALQILGSNDFLASTAMRNKGSLQAAITNVAAIGISLNPASKQAYLVPRDGKVCLDISYMGIMHLAQLTGAIKWGQAVIVRKNDSFTLNDIDKPPTHNFNPFDDASARGDIVGVYVVVKTDTNDYLTHAMPISKVYDIRDRSVAWKSHVSKGTSCPWVTDEEEMVKKTCVKQAAKYWPRRERLDAAVHYVNVEGEEGLASIAEEKEVQGEKLIHGKFKAGSGISAMGGEMEQLSVDMQALLREIAEEVKAVMGNPQEAYGLLGELSAANKLEDEDAGVKVALWSLFSSAERSAMKRAQEELKSIV
jgi:recombination protein RecT